MTAPLIERLGWTLVHSVWQLAALALLLMFLLRLLAGASPRARYNSAALTLLAMGASLPLTFALQPAPRNPTLRVGQLDSESQAAYRRTAPALPQSAQANVISETPASHSIVNQCVAWRDHVRSSIEPWLPTLVVLWTLGAALLSLRPLAGWRAARRLRTVGTSSASPEVRELARRTARRLGITHSVEVVQSTLVQVPGVVGWLSPLILLPVGIANGLTPAQLEGVLAHELAHIRRQDFLVNLLQILAETLLFYHPAVWWVSHQMRLEREDCCDDLALAVCPDRGQFARALLALAELRGGLPSPVMAASGGSLLARIRRIVQGAPASPAQGGGLAGAMAVLILAAALALVVYPGATPTLAEEPARSERSRENTTTPRAGQADSQTQASKDPWFWPDPFSHLGHVDRKGEGWEYVRIAADDATGKELNTTVEQRRQMVQIFKDCEQSERDLGRKLREEGKVDAAAWPARVQKLWLSARDDARKQLTDAQHRRIEQLMIQRKSYNAFRSDELTARLELTPEQRKKVLAAMDAHLRRIQGNQLEFARSKQQLAQTLQGESLANTVRDITRVQSQQGRLSHARVWDEIHGVLSQQQREQFNRLRGPMPESVRSELHLFEPMP